MKLVLPGEEISLNEPRRTFERHHHLGAYVALLVDGSCDEAGDCGRYLARAGDVLVHRPLEAHRDRIGDTGAVIINFALGVRFPASFGSVSDVDAIVRAHERDRHEAAAMLIAQFRPRQPSTRDWPDLLAEALSTPGTRLDAWAQEQGLNPSSLSRGFRLAYGVTPKRFRLEQMASRAARAIRATAMPLSMIAGEADFADQAHMTRALNRLFGVTPRQLRRLS